MAPGLGGSNTPRGGLAYPATPSAAGAGLAASSGALPAGKGAEVGRAALIDALVRNALRGVPGDELQRQALHNRLCGWALRVLGSHLSSSSPSLADAGSVVQAIKQQLRSQQRDADAGSLDDRYARLAASRGISGRGQQAALALLLQLSRGGGGGSGAAALNAIATYQPPRLVKAAPPAPPAGRDTNAARAPDQPGRAAGQLQAAAAARAAGQVPGCTVPEKELVRDALRAAQGCGGSYCSFQGPGSGAEGPADGSVLVVGGGGGGGGDAGVAWPQRTALHLIGELGVMFRAVQAAIDAGTDPSRPRGAVRQALSAALQRELTEFYGFLAGLEQQLPHPLPAPGCVDESVLSAPFLTLRRLLLWTGEPLRRMRLLAALADGTAAADGGALAGAVWGHTKRGDPLARAYATRLLQQVCVPLFDQIRRWVFEGRLVDAHLEFFVVQSAALAAGGGGGGGGGGGAAGGGRDPWREGYRIEGAKLPPFISRHLAESILRAGKGINFLRDACGDAAWVQARAADAARDGDGAGLDAARAGELERVVAAATRRVDARLMAVLRERAGLARHLDALRRYVLLGQGDFAVALLDAMGPELAKPASEVSEVTLNHLLRQALLASAARGDDEDTLERLRAKKEPGAGAREVGWDVFSLHYELGPPLSSAFTPAAMSSYRRVARLQWRLARAERSLGLAWRTLKVEVERELPKFRGAARAGLERLLRSCLRLRADMAHFATNMRTYVTYEVLEGAWREFVAAAGSAPDLDSLIARHEAFLSSLLGRALLDEASAQVRSTLNGVLAGMLGLAPLVARLNDEVKAALLWAEERAAAAAANTAAGRWGVVGGDEEARRDEEVSPELLEELEAVVAQLEAAHLAGARRLTEQLADERTGGVAAAHDEVRHLLARLDRAFYERQAGALADAAAGGRPSFGGGALAGLPA